MRCEAQQMKLNTSCVSVNIYCQSCSSSQQNGSRALGAAWRERKHLFVLFPHCNVTKPLLLLCCGKTEIQAFRNNFMKDSSNFPSQSRLNVLIPACGWLSFCHYHLAAVLSVSFTDARRSVWQVHISNQLRQTHSYRLLEIWERGRRSERNSSFIVHKMTTLHQQKHLKYAETSSSATSAECPGLSEQHLHHWC